MRTPEQKKEAARIRRERRARGEYVLTAETRANMSKATSGEKHPMWGKHHTDEAKAKISEALLGIPLTDETKAKMSKARSGEKNHNHGKHLTDGAKAKISKANSGENHPNYGKHLTEATKAKMSKATSGENNHQWGKQLTDETKQKISKANLGKVLSDETRAKMSKAHSGENNHWYGKTHSSESCKKHSESNKKSFLDKQWYGTVTYPLGQIYCVLFNAEFKERCRAYWEYKSVLEPHKTKEENICRGKPYNLTVHHVYYQPKACCGWDEDLQGYYAMINLGTQRKPNMIRHNIKGDPNKFVILTHSEHERLKSNKLVWIKKFEDMIEKQGGKCYLTKEEMVEHKIMSRIEK